MNNGKKINWSVVETFEDGEGGLVVEVSASDAPRPRYNFRVGRRGERGLIPFIPVFTEGQGSIRVVSSVEKLGLLIERAEEFVREKVQAHEDEYVARRIEREMKQVAREGKKRRPSGYKQHRGPAT